MLDFFRDDEKRTLLFLGISLAALLVSFFNIGNSPIDVAWVAIVLCGIPIIKGAIVGLVTEFDIKADVLVSIALVAAVAIGETFAAGEVAFIMTIGAYLEERTVGKARAGIEKLIDLTPTTARIIENGEERTIPADQVKKGDTLRVIAGETIAVDGTIISGHTSIDQSVMTGESLPVDKAQGDKVFSGTVNQFGNFEMRAEKVGEDSSLQRMVRLVESADADKAKIVRLADRWATWIVVIALSAAVLTWIFTGEIIRSVTILVVFCPCALVLATPTAIMAGIGNLTKSGILVKEGDALERLAKVGRIAFDKTGTLTYGKPSVNEVKSYSSKFNTQTMLQLAASAELLSEHPLGKAIVSYSRNKEGLSELVQPGDFELLSGRGVVAKVENHIILAGNTRLFDQEGITVGQAALADINPLESKGSTIIHVAVDGEFCGFISLSDSVRPDARSTVEAISASGVVVTMLTGDNKQAAQNIASSLEITSVVSDCLPEDKLRLVKAEGEHDPLTAMVGDGVNDAPALKASYVGIAMGGVGSDIAVDSADVVLVGDDIKELPHLIQVAKRTMTTININLTASMLLNFVAIILAITGIMGPVVGALVHNVGSVAVIINSSLLLKWRKREQKESAVVQPVGEMATNAE